MAPGEPFALWRFFHQKNGSQMAAGKLNNKISPYQVISPHNSNHFSSKISNFQVSGQTYPMKTPLRQVNMLGCFYQTST
jgi:hypothetical protein